jgi:hypothetical protein
MITLQQQNHWRWWFEPWRHIHSDWQNQPGWPTWAQTVCARSPQAMRYAFKAWCEHMKIPTEPAQWLFNDDAMPTDWDVSPQQAARSAAFVGAVCWFNPPRVNQAWLEGEVPHPPSCDVSTFSDLDVDSLRGAARLARLRPLPALTEWPDPVLTQNACLLQGMCWVRVVTEWHWPGLWSRLRFRFTPEWVECVEAVVLSAEQTHLHHSEKSVMLAWRQSLVV